LGKIGKGVICSIKNCNSKAERSISRDRLSGSSLDADGSDRRIYLCVSHYKVWKKLTKKERDLDRIRFS